MENVAIEDILAMSAKALALDSGLAEAHASRGLALSVEKRSRRSEGEFEGAIALDPEFVTRAITFTARLFNQGKLE